MNSVGTAQDLSLLLYIRASFFKLINPFEFLKFDTSNMEKYNASVSESIDYRACGEMRCRYDTLFSHHPKNKNKLNVSSATGLLVKTDKRWQREMDLKALGALYKIA